MEERVCERGRESDGAEGQLKQVRLLAALTEESAVYIVFKLMKWPQRKEHLQFAAEAICPFFFF